MEAEKLSNVRWTGSSFQKTLEGPPKIEAVSGAPRGYFIQGAPTEYLIFTPLIVRPASLWEWIRWKLFKR